MSSSITKTLGIDKPLNLLGSVLPLAAPFLGPLGGALGGSVGKALTAAAPWAGAAGSVLNSAAQGQTAQSNANKQVAATQNIATQQQQNAAQLATAFPSILAQAGVGQPAGSNPYAAGAANIYGSDADIANRAAGLYSPATLNPSIVAGHEASAPAYNNAVASYHADQLNRGFNQGDTATDANVANVRAQEAAGNASYDRSLYDQQNQQSNAYIQQQQAARQGLLTNGLGIQASTLSGLGSLANSSAQGALGTIGGLQGFYQGQSNNIQQGQGNLLQSIAGSGGLGSLGNLLDINKLLKRGSPQSQSPGTTGAQSPSPSPYSAGALPGPYTQGNVPSQTTDMNPDY